MMRNRLKWQQAFTRYIGLGVVIGCMMGTVRADAGDGGIPPQPPMRVHQTSMGISQLSNEQMQWLTDDKFGMFIHWGVYSGPAKGEWYMQKAGVSPAAYRIYSTPESGEEYFDASDYHPERWAQLANDAGMKFMCLTARHHEGFCLFDSPYPGAFTSIQTLHRDLLKPYVEACRAAGLKVGIYYSPLSWRYPGYYDVTGKNCAPNTFGYKTDPSHAENARIMKEENYVNVHTLLTKYGKIDYIFWDGGWLAQQGTDADAAYFHEPGKYLDPHNPWPIQRQFEDIEKSTGKALGIMGMVRKYQPTAITNLRYGWIGDISEEEGSKESTGPIKSETLYDKCLTMQSGDWGINAKAIADGNVMTSDQVIAYLANCIVRDMSLLVNVTPDRHGVIPTMEQERLREVGKWLSHAGEAVYGTRAGPWNPVDHQYGYCYRDSTVYVHLLKGYAGETFTMPALGNRRAVKAYDVYSRLPLTVTGGDGQAIVLGGIDRTKSPADTVFAVKFDKKIADLWKK